MFNEKLPIDEYSKSTEEVENSRCGNNHFNDDIWDFKGYVDQPHWGDYKFKLKFSKFDNWESIKLVIKKYIKLELQLVGFASVKRKYDAFNPLVEFLNQNSSINSFEDFTKSTLVQYFDYLLALELSPISKKKAAQVIKELMVRGIQRNWLNSTIGPGIERIYEELIIHNVIIKEGTKLGKTKKVLPSESVISNIIETAKESLNNDKEILVAASIILMSQLGLRISECVTLKTGCLSITDGEYQVNYLVSKVNKTPVNVARPANELVVNAIKHLEAHSEQFRKKANSNYLFLMKSRNKADTIELASYSNWADRRIKPFIENHDLRDEKGNLMKLSAHYFRHIFTTYAIKTGMKLHDVAEMLNHKSIMMTETYDHGEEKQEIIKDILSGNTPVASTNKLVLESVEGDENPFKGRTASQIDKMRKALKIEILPHGLCLHHPMRGDPCEQDGICLGCSEFLASAKHLPVYKKRLEKVNQQLAEPNLDQSIFTTKLRYQQGKLENYISDLERKVAVKEGKSL